MYISTSRLGGHMKMLVQPTIEGHEILDCPSFSFLVKHPSGRKILFDLGTRKDWENFPPTILKIFKEHQLTAKVEKNVSEILEEHGFAVSEGAIEAVIFSHWHYDHIGDMSTFPSSTALVVGPGFKEAFVPGYPARPDGLLRQSDYEGRELREVSFDTKTHPRIGGCLAVDFFGDGSFYLLDAPGHAIGHLCALARTSIGGDGEQDTFIFMGGDACHHAGEFRPTEYLPLPTQIQLHSSAHWPKGICPGAIMQQLHHKKSACEPFYDMAEGFALNRGEAEQTIRNLEAFDAAENVFVVIAHDQTLLDIGMSTFPKGVSDWKKKGYAEDGRWAFLEDFSVAASKITPV
ncbi:hypothetical protein PV10_01648 [Exophiala mesophila]|uniref:Metallo-beta-lactamase domain-containing protein n=1 Tax=Exophiala mesophila TaxID=212818 RepID=A0A0D2AGB4_EXOME|nr:uncharacterized protein PV10_01648 [Exophiala mesophila]KIV97953.1 hypothetical protein PV10_01648 [Exophiala mesophila]